VAVVNVLIQEFEPNHRSTRSMRVDYSFATVSPIPISMSFG